MTFEHKTTAKQICAEMAITLLDRLGFFNEMRKKRTLLISKNSKSQNILPSISSSKNHHKNENTGTLEEDCGPSQPQNSVVTSSGVDSKLKMLAGRSPYLKMYEQEEELCKLSKKNPKISQSQKVISVSKTHKRDKSKSYKTSGGIYDLIKQDRRATEGYVSQSVDFKILKKQYLRTSGAKDHVQHSIDKIERLKRKLQRINDNGGGVQYIPENRKMLKKKNEKTPKGFFRPKIKMNKMSMNHLKTTPGSTLAYNQSNWSRSRLKKALNNSVLVKNSPPRGLFYTKNDNKRNGNRSLLQTNNSQQTHVNSFVLELDAKIHPKCKK